MAERIEVIIDGNAYGLVQASGQGRTALRALGTEAAVQTRGARVFNEVLDQQQRNLAGVARFARGAGLALATGLALGMAHAIKTGADFEQQMARVAAVSSATGDEMERLEKLAMRMGAQTKFSAGEAAAAMYELSSAGFSVKEMSQALPGTLSLAAASNIDLASAAEISSNALRGFGLDADQSTHVADVLAQAVNSSSVEMEDLQLTMKYIGPIAKATGQDFEDMIGAVSLMGDAGIKGEQAGTALRAGLLRLVKPIGQTKEGLAALGLSAKDVTGPDGLLPLPELVGAIQGGMEGMSKAEQNAALTAVFGQEALSGMLTVVDAGPEKLARLAKEFDHADGASKKAADTMNKTVTGAWEQFTGSIETVEIALFQNFKEPLREALMDATDLINTEGKNITDFFDSISDDPEFLEGSLTDRISYFISELKASNVGDEVKELFEDVDLGETLGEAISEATPEMAEAIAEGVPDVISAFAQAFTSSNVWGRVVIGAFVVQKLGLGPAFMRTAGLRDGVAYREGFQATAGMPGVGGAVPVGSKAKTSTPKTLSTPYGPMANPIAGAGVSALSTTGQVARRWGGAALSLGRNILGVNLAFGLISGISSEAPNMEGRLQDVFASMDLGLTKSWAEQAEEAAASIQKGLEEGLPKDFDFGDIGIGESRPDLGLSQIEIDPDQMAIFREQMKGAFGDGEDVFSVSLFDTLGDFSTRMKEAQHATELWRMALNAAHEEGKITDEDFESLSGSIDQAFDAFIRGKEKADRLRQGIHEMRVGFHGDLSSVQKDAESNMTKIESSFGRHSDEGRRLIASNMKAAEHAIRVAMEQGRIDADKGLQAINDLIRQNLSRYGIKGADAEKILLAKNAPRDKDGGFGDHGLQRGGMPDEFDVPGSGSGDKVDLRARVEPGERVFVLNRNASEKLRQLRSLNSQIPRFQKGGELGIPPGGFPDADGALPGLDALAWVLRQKFGLSVVDGRRPAGTLTSTGGISDHSWGGAIDVSNGVTTPQMDAANAFMREVLGGGGAFSTNYSGGAIKQMLYRTLVGGDHFNHIHVALLEQYANSAAAVMKLIGGKGLAGLSGIGGIGALDLNLPRFEAKDAVFASGAAGMNNMVAGLEKEIAARVAAMMPAAGGAAFGNVSYLSGGEGSVVAQMGKILLASGFDREAAAGVIGNAWRESHWDPASVGTGGGGLFGFTTGAVSLAALQAFAARQNKPWTDVGVQMALMLNEGGLETREPMNAMSNTDATTEYFMRVWERPGVLALEERQAAAQRALSMFAEGGLLDEAKDRSTEAREQIRGLGKREEHIGGRISDLQSQLFGAGKGDRADRLRDELHHLKDRAHRIDRRMGTRRYELSAAKQLREAAREQIAGRDRGQLLNEELGPILSGFPYVGAFAAGTGGRRIGRTGIALVHRDEQIRPDPQGPFGSQLAGKTIGNDSPVDVRLTVELDSGRLIKVVDARVDGRAAKVVDRELGRKSRQISFAPGG